MSGNRDIITRDEADWLDTLLRGHREPSEAFHKRCEQAVESGLSVARLRQTKERRGLPLLGIPGLLRMLAAGSAESVATVATWAGLDLRVPTSLESAGAWGRLAAALELSRDEALFHLRMTFAEVLGGGPEALLSPVSLRDDDSRDFLRGHDAVTVADLNDQLDRDARSRDASFLDQLRVCEQAMHTAWQAEAAEAVEG